MSTKTCQNCDVAYGPDDMFCENCGYDFITGSLPVDGGGPAAPAPSSNPKSVGGVPPARGSAPSGKPAVGKPSAGGPDGGAEVGSVSAAGSAPAEGTGPDPTVETPAPPSLLSPDPDPRSGGGPSGSAAPGGGAASSTPAGSPETGEVSAGSPGTGGQVAGPASSLPDVPRLRLSVTVDRMFFDEVVNDGEIEFPDPVPVDQELELAGSELHVGRTSESRAIHPDIDVAKLTGDQAVSSRHAVIRVANDGMLTIVDVGSTNGTFLDSVDTEAITHGIPMEVKPGVPIYVGAWTRLTILDS